MPTATRVCTDCRQIPVQLIHLSNILTKLFLYVATIPRTSRRLDFSLLGFYVSQRQNRRGSLPV